MQLTSNGNVINGGTSTYELLSRSGQPSTLQENQPVREEEGVLWDDIRPIGPFEEIRTPPKKQRRIFLPTPGKDMLPFWGLERINSIYINLNGKRDFDIRAF